MIVALSTICFATSMLQDTTPAVELIEPSLQWTRRTEGENLVSLELVSRRYEVEGKPDLWLVGVAHIADGSFYEEIAALLDEMDIVLYESVRPTGSRPPSGITEEEKVASTKLSLEFVADIAKRASEESELIPESLEDIFADALLLDRRLAGWVEDASVDAWGRPFALQVNEEQMRITFWSFGSDGAVGGKGSGADLTSTRVLDILTEEELLEEEELMEAGIFLDDDSVDKEKEEAKGVQAELADALNLEFQLESLPYEDPNWFCSDLTIGEVEAKLVERGADTSLLNSLTGESFVSKIAVGMMKVIPMLDGLTGGGFSETARLLMIEVLSAPSMGKMLEGIDTELSQVIIIDRNTEVLRDIASTIAVADEISTIGVLYGAGHMEDLSSRLYELFGYLPVEDRWFSTMKVDPRKSMLDEKYMRQMRVMMQIQLKNASKIETKDTD
ncbi:MAG: hypothetical protein HOC21_07595 [Phycisphaerae bacterium]|nr:hypothetical protein [Phycisphaerae bacterium]